MGKAWKIDVNVGPVREKVREAAVLGLKKAADDVLAESEKIVPIDEGMELSKSGETSVDPNELRAAVSYGRNGIARAYAERQHEELQLRHDDGRRAKFLEDPLNQSRSRSAQTIAAEMRRALNS